MGRLSFRVYNVDTIEKIESMKATIRKWGNSPALRLPTAVLKEAGHEQAGHRPALVISPANYNGKTGLMIYCPLSTKIKGHPFEVLAEIDGMPCAILSDQVKSLDWKVRRAKRKAAISAETMLHVKAKMKALLQIP
jgi:mRNA interferase MazF